MKQINMLSSGTLAILWVASATVASATGSVLLGVVSVGFFAAAVYTYFTKERKQKNRN